MKKTEVEVESKSTFLRLFSIATSDDEDACSRRSCEDRQVPERSAAAEDTQKVRTASLLTPCGSSDVASNDNGPDEIIAGKDEDPRVQEQPSVQVQDNVPLNYRQVARGTPREQENDARLVQQEPQSSSSCNQQNPQGNVASQIEDRGPSNALRGPNGMNERSRHSSVRGQPLLPQNNQAGPSGDHRQGGDLQQQHGIQHVQVSRSNVQRVDPPIENRLQDGVANDFAHMALDPAPLRDPAPLQANEMRPAPLIGVVQRRYLNQAPREEARAVFRDRNRGAAQRGLDVNYIMPMRQRRIEIPLANGRVWHENNAHIHQAGMPFPHGRHAVPLLFLPPEHAQVHDRRHPPRGHRPGDQWVAVRIINDLIEMGRRAVLRVAHRPGNQPRPQAAEERAPHDAIPMPRDEQPPAGLDEAPPPEDMYQMEHHQDQPRRERTGCFSGCFAFLRRPRRQAALPLHVQLEQREPFEQRIVLQH